MASSGKIKSIAGALLRHLPLSAWTWLAPKDAVGLCYHMVSDRNLPHLRHYPFLTPKEFEADLDYVAARFGFLSYDELARQRAASQALRRNQAVLTFDDGFAEC